MFYKILYTVFLVVCFLYPFEYVVGPVALRHILALMVLVWLIAHKQIKNDWVVYLFVIYLFFCLLSSVLTGFFTSFLPTLVGTFFLCLIMYWATMAMMKMEAGGKWILYTLLSIAIVDSIVTIAQFLNLSLAQQIANFLHVSLIDETTWDNYERYGGAVGGLVAGGLLRGVKNGYFLCSAVIFSLMSGKGGFKFKNALLCLFLSIALFVTQERAALYLGVLCLAIYFIISVSAGNRQRSAKLILYGIAILVIVAASGLFSYVNFGETRYAILGGGADGRDVYWAKAFEFVRMHPLGGAYAFYADGGYPPHNFIPNSYVNGGLFGGTIVVALVFAQIGICVKLLFEAFYKKNHTMPVVALALIYLGYTGNSCFHNLALSMGDETAFMWWAILVSLLAQEKEADRNPQESVQQLNTPSET